MDVPKKPEVSWLTPGYRKQWWGRTADGFLSGLSLSLGVMLNEVKNSCNNPSRGQALGLSFGACALQSFRV